MTLRATLQQIVKSWRQIQAPPGAWIVEEFLLRVGIECVAQSLPLKYPKMQEEACFENTAQLVRTRRGLRYCEGFVRIKMLDLPLTIHHAWAIDADNRVIDPTLRDPEAFEFIGFPIPLTERRRWVSRKCQCVLDTGYGRNVRFIVEQCPAILTMMDEKHRRLVDRHLHR